MAKALVFKIRYSLFSLLCLVVATNVYSQAPKYSNEFLSIGVGARGLAMSNSQVATVNDATSSYWNPAGILGVGTSPQVALMHAEYFAGIAKYDFGAIAKKIDSTSALAISVIRFGVDNIPNTTELIDANGNVDYNRITSFSAVDYAFMGSYAKRLKVPNLTLGVNAKVIHRIIGNFANSWGFGLDAGLQYNYKKWHMGLMARDITSTFNAWSYSLSDKTKQVFTATGNEIPSNSVEVTLPRFILGIGRKHNFNKNVFLLGEINFDATTDGKRNVLISAKPFSIDPRMGLELGLWNLVFIRAGVGNIQHSKDILGKEITTYQPNMGIGLQFRSICIDYALTDIGDQSVALYSNIFSLKFDINRIAKKK